MIVARHDADRTRLRFKDREQRKTADAGVGHPVDADFDAVQIDDAVAPGLERGCETRVGLGVLLAQEFERAAGEGETEAEGRALRVLLEDFDRDIRPRALQPIGEIETRGTGTKDGDAHVIPSTRQ